MDSLRTAFDAETFRAQGHRVIDQLADYLAGATRGDAMPVLPWSDPAEMVAAWPPSFSDSPRAGVDELLTRIVAQSNHLHHPRYVGHQVTAPLPLAALCDLVAALLNNGTAVYEMGPVSTAMERSLVRWMAGLLGFDQHADGIFTSGGSVGNLTALLAARQAYAGFDVWTRGAHAGPPLAVLASEQTHYCVQRAVQIMGWGREGVIAVPVDARFRLRVDALPEALHQAERAGRRVIAVVASAGSHSDRRVRSARVHRRLLRGAPAVVARRRRARRVRRAFRTPSPSARRHRARRLRRLGRPQDAAHAGARHRRALP